MIEVVCPRHGRVDAEVSDATSAAGPPCPACGGACTIYAPMLALARACVDAAPRLGTTRLLQILRQDGGDYAPVARPGPEPFAAGDPADSTHAAALLALAAPPARE